MKILQLRFKNLNSLMGEWVIDFTAPAYQTEGIFAITGPTGAGKSTILDAICLALYGRTPRLPRINKTTNEIMSRQTGECFAELTFSSQNETLRCHWSQNKARKNPRANLVDYKHEISNASTGELLESKKSNVPNVVEEKTGMDFDRFTRAILLAQGGFDTFLKATSDKRSPILEQITGTSIYSEISLKVHERKSSEEKKLHILEADASGVFLLSEEREDEIQRELALKTGKEKELATVQQQTETAITWHNTIETLRAEYSTLLQEKNYVSLSITEFEPNKILLEKAKKAAELNGSFSSLQEMRRQQQEAYANLQHNETQLPTIANEFSIKEAAVLGTNKDVSQARLAHKTALPQLRQARAIDVELQEKKKRLTELEIEFNQLTQQITGHQSAKTALVAQQIHATKLKEQTVSYLTTHSQDQILVGDLTGICEKAEQIHIVIDQGKEHRTSLTTSQFQVEQNRNHLQKQSDIFATQNKQYLFSQQKLEESQSLLQQVLAGRLIREYRAEWDALHKEISYLRKISDLETERQRLVAGKACPLCGSTTHPFAAENIPDATKEELQLAQLKLKITQIEQLETTIKQSLEDERKNLLAIASTEKELTTISLNLEAQQKETGRLQQLLTKSTEQYEQLRQQLLTILHPLGFSILPKDLRHLLVELKDRQQLWVKHQTQLSIQELEMAEITAKISTEETFVQAKTLQFLVQQQILVSSKEEYQKLVEKRHHLYGNKDIDTEESKLEKNIEYRENIAEKAKEELQQTRLLLATIQTQIATLKADITKRKTTITDCEDTFLVQCEKMGFEDEAAFLQSTLVTEQRMALEEQQRNLHEKMLNIISRKKDREKKLLEEQEKNVSTTSRVDLQGSLVETQHSLKTLGEEIGALKQQYAENQKAQIKIADKKVAIDLQKKELRRWANLHSLIGSSDGKKYRNFAQGLTFELMVNHANQQLEKMTDRYLLIRDEREPLELNVIDNYQAGEERSTQNLSGGESFIVSLALALGLSNMASHKVRVDSLFLDEGFGTLDEEALETALATLSSLQRDDKTIGVISHVSALKERISTQIQVEPRLGGKSGISGPGCEEIRDF